MLQDNSLEALILYFLTRAVSAFDLPTTTSLYGAQCRIRTWHTCILFIVKSKRGSMEELVMLSRSKGASVGVDGWMDEYGLLLKVMSFLSRIIHVSLFFLRHGYPFFSLHFFWVMLLWHAIFSSFFLGQPKSGFISGLFYERNHRNMEHLLM